MGERKVLDKYYPPESVLAKLPQGKQAPSNEMKLPMMLPVSVCCNTCGNFTHKGTEFNTRDENVEEETYLATQSRLYFDCRNCAAEFTLKTDLQDGDYVVEGGASRSHKLQRESDEVQAQNKKVREEEEMGNAVKALGNRPLDGEKGVDNLSTLDENSQHSKVSPWQVALFEYGDEQAELQSFLGQQAYVEKRTESDNHDAPAVRPHSDVRATNSQTAKPVNAAAPQVMVEHKRKMADSSAIPDGKRAKAGLSYWKPWEWGGFYDDSNVPIPVGDPAAMQAECLQVQAAIDASLRYAQAAEVFTAAVELTGASVEEASRAAHLALQRMHDGLIRTADACIAEMQEEWSRQVLAASCNR